MLYDINLYIFLVSQRAPSPTFFSYIFLNSSLTQQIARIHLFKVWKSVDGALIYILSLG